MQKFVEYTNIYAVHKSVANFAPITKNEIFSLIHYSTF